MLVSSPKKEAFKWRNTQESRALTSSATIFKCPLKNKLKLEIIFFRQKRSCVVEVVANCNCAQMTKEEREILLASSAARGHYSEVSFCYSESSSSPSSSSSQLLQYWVKSTLHRAWEFRTTIRLLLGASVAIARRRRLLGNASICMRQLKHFWRKISPPLLLLPSAFTSISAPMIPTLVALPEVARKQN